MTSERQLPMSDSYAPQCLAIRYRVRLKKAEQQLAEERSSSTRKDGEIERLSAQRDRLQEQLSQLRAENADLKTEVEEVMNERLASATYCSNTSNGLNFLCPFASCAYTIQNHLLKNLSTLTHATRILTGKPHDDATWRS